MTSLANTPMSSSLWGGLSYNALQIAKGESATQSPSAATDAVLAAHEESVAAARAARHPSRHARADDASLAAGAIRALLIISARFGAPSRSRPARGDRLDLGAVDAPAHPADSASADSNRACSEEPLYLDDPSAPAAVASSQRPIAVSGSGFASLRTGTW